VKDEALLVLYVHMAVQPKVVDNPQANRLGKVNQTGRYFQSPAVSGFEFSSTTTLMNILILP
jgi:hypothetical protein